MRESPDTVGEVVLGIKGQKLRDKESILTAAVRYGAELWRGDDEVIELDFYPGSDRHAFMMAVFRRWVI